MMILEKFDLTIVLEAKRHPDDLSHCCDASDWVELRKEITMLGKFNIGSANLQDEKFTKVIDDLNHA